MAGFDSNIIETYPAICWDIPLIANRTRCGCRFSVISNNRFSQGTISRKDLPSNHVEILRDFTPESREYLAGLLDGDGYIGKTVVELTLATEERYILPYIQNLVGGGSVSPRKDCAAWRYRVWKQRHVLIDNTKPYLAHDTKLYALQRWYNYTLVSTNSELSPW